MEQGTLPLNIGYFAFTRKAATEAKERAVVKFPHLQGNSDFPWFRTLHSLAYRCLGVKQNDMMSPEHFREFAKLARLTLTVEESDEEGFVKTDNPILNEINLARIRGMDLRTHYNQSGLSIEWWHFEFVERTYRQYKEQRMLFDFTDLLEKILLEPERLPTLEMTIIDEAQDLSRLQWNLVKALIERSSTVYIAGDDDQCQPVGTKVLTSTGAVEIQDLNPKTHRLVCYDKKGSYVVGLKDGYSFSKTSRMYLGDLITVTTHRQKLTSSYTEGHHCIVRWKSLPADERSMYRVVYLMQKGDDFRIGQCQLFRADGCVHAWVRAHLEKADSMWFLAVTKNHEECSFLESLYSYGYGIPQTVFVQSVVDAVLKQKSIDKLFSSLPTKNSAIKLLQDLNLCFNYPIYSRKDIQQRRGGSQIFSTRAVNLFPDLMVLAEKAADKKIEWSSFSLRKEKTKQVVYSLAVEKHHNYFADGILTHNCIYRWAGADVDTFLDLPGETIVLDQSYRVPPVIHNVANNVSDRIRVRQPKVWRPKEGFEGVIHRYNRFSDVDVTKGGNWLILAFTNYYLTPIHGWLLDQGVLFERNGHRSVSETIVRAVIGWENLRKGKEVDYATVALIYKHLGTEFVKRGNKAFKDGDPNAFYTMQKLKDHHGLLTDVIWHEALTKIAEDKRNYIIALLRRGVRLLGEAPVKLSTVHAAKGGEADNVLLRLDLSARFMEELQKNPDDMRRLLYVGLTRAKRELHIVEPETYSRGFTL